MRIEDYSSNSESVSMTILDQNDKIVITDVVRSDYTDPAGNVKKGVLITIEPITKAGKEIRKLHTTRIGICNQLLNEKLQQGFRNGEKLDPMRITQKQSKNGMSYYVLESF